MRWVITSGPNALLQEYHLMENNECRVVLKYNPLHRSARVSCGKYQRLFFIESAGALTGKKIFKNEYGMELGHLSEKANNNEGLVVIEDKKYHYQLQNNSSTKLTVSDNDSHPLASCTLKPESDNPLNVFSKNSIDGSYLLLGLCWYLSLPIAKEKLEFAA